MKIKIYVDGRRPNKDGTKPIRFRFTPTGHDSFLVSTGMSCTHEPNQMTFPPEEIDARTKTLRLMKLYTACQEFVMLNPGISLTKLKAELTRIISGKDQKKLTISDMFERFTQNKYEGTRNIYARTLVKILEFDRKADLNDIDKLWLERFEKYLRNEGASTNGISLHMRNLRAVFNFALDEEVITNYPFRKYHIKSEQTRKRDLTIEQLRALKKCRCRDFEKRYRDMFMLIFYLCGINIGDLLLLKHDNVINGRIEYYRRKTKKYYSIRIEPEAQAIIDRYKGKDWLLNISDTYRDYHDFMRRMNRAIRKIQHKGKAICPTLSTYYARHTWASLAAEIDIPMDTIAQALGHSTPYSTTDIYVNRRLKKIDEANRKVIDYLYQSDL